MSRGIIYLITNKENGHKYVGQTTQGMNKQWQQHTQEALRMSDKPLHRAMRKYGQHRFNIQEIDECDENLLDEREKHWIKHYNTLKEGYNVGIIIPEEVEKKSIIPITNTKPKVEPWGSFTDKNRGNGKHCGLRIKGKNLTTGIVTEYENARIAAFEVTGDPNKNANILRAAKCNGTSYNHKWQILEDKSKKKSVFGVNKKTEQIEIRYESVAEAVRELRQSGRGTGLIKSLRNPGRYSYRGYYWFYG